MLSSSLPWDVDNYSVCDNVDLKIIVEEFASYHQVMDDGDLLVGCHYIPLSQVKYGKRPDICRRSEREPGDTASLQGNPARRKRAQRTLNKMKRSSSFNNNSPAVPEGGGMAVTGVGCGMVEAGLDSRELVLPPSLLQGEESRCPTTIPTCCPGTWWPGWPRTW